MSSHQDATSSPPAEEQPGPEVAEGWPRTLLDSGQALPGGTDGPASIDSGAGGGEAGDAAASLASPPTLAEGCAELPLTSQSPLASTPSLPPRLVVFQPDGQFEIGIDPRRSHLLKPSPPSESSDLAARLHRQHAAAAAAAAAEDENSLTYAAWQRIYSRQKALLYVLLLLDVIYMCALIIVQQNWSATDSVSAVVEFFIGRKPQGLSISFLCVTLILDLLTGYAALRDWGSLLTLSVIWSIVLMAFGVVLMPLLFLVLRIVLMVSGFQCRFSLARVRNLMRPASVSDWVADGWHSIARIARAAARAAARPLTRQRQARQQQQLALALEPATGRELPTSNRQLAIALRNTASYQSSLRHMYQRELAEAALAMAAAASAAEEGRAQPAQQQQVQQLDSVAVVADQSDQAGGQQQQQEQQLEQQGRQVEEESGTLVHHHYLGRRRRHEEGEEDPPIADGVGRSPRSRSRRSRRRLEAAEAGPPGSVDSMDQLYSQLMRDLEAASAGVDHGGGGASSSGRRLRSRRSRSRDGGAGVRSGSRQEGGLDLAGPSTSQQQAQHQQQQQDQQEVEAGRHFLAFDDALQPLYQHIIFLQLATGPHILVQRRPSGRSRQRPAAGPPRVPLITIEAPPLLDLEPGPEASSLPLLLGAAEAAPVPGLEAAEHREAGLSNNSTASSSGGGGADQSAGCSTALPPPPPGIVSGATSRCDSGSSSRSSGTQSGSWETGSSECETACQERRLRRCEARKWDAVEIELPPGGVPGRDAARDRTS